MMIKVSVIIPVYNTEKFLRRCLDSVCNQTLKDIEIICVNDASPDNSAAILAEYAARDPRMKVIAFEQNRGVSAARNAGMRLAMGEYIGFVDADDFIEVAFCEKLYSVAASSNADTVKGSLMRYCNEQQRAWFEESLDINSRVRQDKAYFYYTFSSALYRRAFIEEHNISFPVGYVHFEDPVFSIRAALFYDSLAFCDDAVYYYCINRNSVTLNLTVRHVQSTLDAAREIAALFCKHDISLKHKLIVYNFVMDNLLAFYRHGGENTTIGEQAAIGIAEMLGQCPTSLEQWLRFRVQEQQCNQTAFRIRQLRRGVRKALSR